MDQEHISDTEPPIQILEVAVHALNYQERGLVLSDSVLELSLPLAELFQSYIAKAMQSDGLRLARWAGDGETRDQVRSVFSDPTGFLDASRRLAEEMASAMRSRSRSAGDLAVVRAVDDNSGQELLAILKLEHGQGFRREVVVDATGTHVRLTPAEDLMPGPERRLQKAAFIPAPPHEFPYDLAFLDNQTTGKGEAAGFFTAEFLECQLIEGPKDYTRRLPEETERWLQEEGIQPTIAIQAREAVVQALYDPEVNIERLADEITSGGEQRQRLMDRLESSGFQSAPFVPDRAVADKMCATLTYILDGGVRITGDAELVSELLKVDLEPTADGKVRIVIESARFERKY